MYVKGDKTRLIQVLNNILSNAIKFTSKGSVQLNIGGEYDPANNYLLTITVKDTGIGIAPEKQEAVFNAFIQANHSIASKFGGTGLGLTISKKLISLMNGEISLASELGVGSTFTIQLPYEVAVNQKELLPKTAVSYGIQLNYKILIVDDNELNLFVAEKLLQQIWPLAQLTTVNNGRDAIALAESNYYDVVLLDLSMPEMDGFEVINSLRFSLTAKNKAIKVIALSAFVDKKLQERCFATGFDDYMSKPFKKEELAEKIHQHLQQNLLVEAS